MFDTSFAFSKIQTTQGSYKNILYEHIFQFRTEKRRYVVIVEEYSYGIFVIKFYPADKKRYPARYNLILNDYEFAPIIRTCVNIMLLFLEENPKASFGYLGANSITSRYEEPKIKTQRYRIYEYVMTMFFRLEKFEKVYSWSNSGVLLLNRDNPNVEELKALAISMFIEIYPDLENDYNQ